MAGKGEVWCIHRPSHLMVEVMPRKLWVCEDYASGTLVHQLGAVEEARRIIYRMGGFSVVREQIRRAETERKRNKKREKARVRRGAAVAGLQQTPLPPPVD